MVSVFFEFPVWFLVTCAYVAPVSFDSFANPSLRFFFGAFPAAALGSLVILIDRCDTSAAKRTHAMNRKEKCLGILAQSDGHFTTDDYSSANVDRWREPKRHIGRTKGALALVRIEHEARTP